MRMNVQEAIEAVSLIFVVCGFWARTEHRITRLEDQIAQIKEACRLCNENASYRFTHRRDP